MTQLLQFGFRLPLLAALLASGIALGALASTDRAHAAEPFICPVVGDGVLHASDVNNDNGVTAITPEVGTSFLPAAGRPGQNQAGMHSNPQAHNPLGPVEGAGPGHNPDYSPIWSVC